MNSGWPLATVAVCGSRCSSVENCERAASTMSLIMFCITSSFSSAARPFATPLLNVFSPAKENNRDRERLCLIQLAIERRIDNSDAYLVRKSGSQLCNKNHGRHAVNRKSVVYSNAPYEHVLDIELSARTRYRSDTDRISWKNSDLLLAVVIAWKEEREKHEQNKIRIRSNRKCTGRCDACELYLNSASAKICPRTSSSLYSIMKNHVSPPR